MGNILKLSILAVFFAAPLSSSLFSETSPDQRIPAALNNISRTDINPISKENKPKTLAANTNNIPRQPATKSAASQKLEAAQPFFDPPQSQQQNVPENQPSAVPQAAPDINSQQVPQMHTASYEAAPKDAPYYQPESQKAMKMDPASSTDFSGIASYYADKFQGRYTASGEIFDMNKFTAAHQTLPFGTVVEVTNLNNSKTVQVVINDRGPFIKNRIIDLSYKAAETIDMVPAGIAPVNLRIISLGSGQQQTASQNSVPENLSVDDAASEPEIKENVAGNKIQVGSFSVKKSATAVAVFLSARGFNPVIEQARPFEKTVYRVIIPFDSPAEAQSTKRTLGILGFTDAFLRRS